GKSCGAERKVAGSAWGTWPSLSLLRRRACAGCGVLMALPRRTALAVATVLTAVAVTEAAAIAIAVAEPKTAVVALAIAVDLAHHRGRALLVLAHSNREIAHHILAQPLLPLDLVESGRRRLDVEQGEMRFAVLAQPIGQGFHAPLFGLGDLAAHLLDDGFELGGQVFDLLRARVLARDKDVFIERHGCLSSLGAPPGAKPFETFRERLECSEGGNTGRRTIGSCRTALCHAAVRSVPSRERAEAAVLRRSGEKGRRRGGVAGLRAHPPPLARRAARGGRGELL